MKDLFKNIENKTGVKMNDVFDLTQSLQGANLKDEKTVRDLVRRVGQMANKKVPKETEDKIVEMLIKKNQKPDVATISKMINQKK